MLEGFGEGIQYFGMIFARVSGLIFIAPVFSAASVTSQMKLIFIFVISVVLYTVVRPVLPPLGNNPGEYMLLITSQVLMGLLIGYMITLIFAAFQMAGEIFSVQVGLSFSEVLDPQSQVSSPILGTLKNTIGLLLFVAVDFEMDGLRAPGLHHMFRALAYSFKAAPAIPMDMQTLGGILATMDQLMGLLFLTALHIGIPVIGILFISSVALGLMGRMAPQMNLMNMGLQINIITGIFVIIFITPVVTPLMLDAFYTIYDRIAEMLNAWPGKVQ
jgi:flagellar biosynthetic protein FliR